MLGMALLQHVTLEVDDPATAADLYAGALGLGPEVRVRASDAPTSGFRGFTLSLVVAEPATVDGFADAAVAAGATVLLPPKKSLWGYGGAVQAPDGTVVTLASSSKKGSGPATREIDELVVQLGVDDVKASKQLYLDHGFTVTKSFGGKYVEIAPEGSPLKLALLKRKLLAKNAGLPPEGSGSHRVVLGSDTASFTDLDGFVWQATARP